MDLSIVRRIFLAIGMGNNQLVYDFRKYVLVATTLGLGGWVIANVIGNYLMSR